MSRCEHRGSRKRREYVQRLWGRSVAGDSRWQGGQDGRSRGTEEMGLRHGRGDTRPYKPGLEVARSII